MVMEENAIEFWATVAQVRTMADGGLRVVLDLPESAIAEVAQLMECKRQGVVLDMTAKPKDDDSKVVIGNA